MNLHHFLYTSVNTFPKEYKPFLILLMKNSTSLGITNDLKKMPIITFDSEKIKLIYLESNVSTFVCSVSDPNSLFILTQNLLAESNTLYIYKKNKENLCKG